MPFGLILFAHLLRMKTADLKYVLKRGLEMKRDGQRMLLHVIVFKREYVMDRYITAVDNAPESDPECLLRTCVSPSSCSVSFVSSNCAIEPRSELQNRAMGFVPASRNS